MIKDMFIKQYAVWVEQADGLGKGSVVALFMLVLTWLVGVAILITVLAVTANVVSPWAALLLGVALVVTAFRLGLHYTRSARES